MSAAVPSAALLGQEQALVIFSGGQDSATCLAWALSRFQRVLTLGFDYGQRHSVELTCRQRLRAGLAGLDPLWASRLGPDTLLDVDIFRQLADTALTSDTPIAADGPGGLPTTFVPGRNLLFILHAAIWYWASARAIFPAIRTAATTASRPCRWRSIWAWTAALSCTRR